MMLSGRSLFSRAASSSAAASSSSSAITVAAGVVSGKSAFGSRRYSSSSSSKPSSPSDGTRTSLPQTSSSTTSATATSTPSRKRMVYGRRSAARLNQSVRVTAGPASSNKAGYATVTLPHVPSTEHIQPKDLALSNFFAQHRPVSITHPLPLSFPTDHFAKLFEPGQAQALNYAAAQAEAAQDFFQPDENGQVQAVINVNTHTGQTTVRPANQPQHSTTSSAQNQHIAIDYLPFHPPPVPEPFYELRALSGRLVQRRAMRKRLASLVAKYKADSAAATSKQLSSNFFTPARIVNKKINNVEIMEDVTHGDQAIKSPIAKKDKLQALSVKRQRKLKMKKHKYKKLMKKTRTLRRKLENR